MKVFFVLLSVLVLLSSCSSKQQQEPGVKYKTLRVEFTDRTLKNGYAASLRGRQYVEIRPQVDGIITEIRLNEGDVVKKGQVLVIIDQAPYTAALEMARLNLSYTVVKSPADGVVGTLPYRVGALVSSALAQPLTTVSDNSDMYVYFSMTENQLLGLIRQYGSKEEALKNMPAIDLQLNDKSAYSVRRPGVHDNARCKQKKPPVGGWELQKSNFL